MQEQQLPAQERDQTFEDEESNLGRDWRCGVGGGWRYRDRKRHRQGEIETYTERKRERGRDREKTTKTVCYDSDQKLQSVLWSPPES